MVSGRNEWSVSDEANRAHDARVGTELGYATRHEVHEPGHEEPVVSAASIPFRFRRLLHFHGIFRCAACHRFSICNLGTIVQLEEFQRRRGFDTHDAFLGHWRT
jgi:hypothetical protein